MKNNRNNFIIYPPIHVNLIRHYYKIKINKGRNRVFKVLKENNKIIIPHYHKIKINSYKSYSL